MPDKPIEISQSDLLSSRREVTAVESFLHAAVYSGVQTPLTGLAQLVDRTAGTELLPKVQIIAPPEDPHSFSAGAGSLSATFAHGIGMVALGHKIAGPVTDWSSFGRRTLTCAGLGAVYGGVLTPVADSENFVAGRMRNLTSGTLAVGSMSAFSSVYKDVIAGGGLNHWKVPPYGVFIEGSILALGPIADRTTSNLIGDKTEYPPNGVFFPSYRLKGSESFIAAPLKQK